MENIHLHVELSRSADRVTAQTRYGPVHGGRAFNGAAAFLEIPYALPPGRFQDPQPLPGDFRYADNNYIREDSYGVQPKNDGQAGDVTKPLQDSPFEDKVGLGEPSENPLFLNIVAPPSFPAKRGFPVKIYIHGGFLQFGSPHSLGSQAQYIATERSEIWVNVGYRLSAFGFLASDEPRLDGNYGFKDQWLALLWIKENINAFGGNPNDIQLTGLSAGAHSVHQLLHHASHLPDGQPAPFNSAILQSNAILVDPKTPTELQPQFDALCRALGLDPRSSDVLTILRDPSRTPWSSITRIIENEMLGEHGTFRGCLQDGWLPVSPGLMEWQRSGSLARNLRAKGVRSVVLGDLPEEWYLYSIAHPVKAKGDIALNLRRYFSSQLVEDFIQRFGPLPEDATQEEVEGQFGRILSCLQVHLPVRMLARDLQAAGYPVLRYEVQWVPEVGRKEGYVTHGADRCLWAFRLPTMEPSDIAIAREWNKTIAAERAAIENNGQPTEGVSKVLCLKADKTIAYTPDLRWKEFMDLEDVLSK